MEKCSPDEQKITGYARVPRIIRKGYTNLSKLQKLLYIYLRDLCGETGMCYRSLRTLADETDFSIGFLSKNIPVLAQEGLITAEMKKRNGQKWEIWHISIVDIWKKNADFLLSEKCSPDEQNSVHEKNSSPDEQNKGKSVHGMNENDQKCSRGVYKEESVLNKNPLLNKNQSTNVQTLTPDEQKMSDWIEDIEGKIRLTADRKKEYAELVPYVKSLEDMMSLRDFAKARIPNHNDNTRVYPKNMANCVKAWAKNKPKQQQEKPATTDQEDESRLVLWTRKMFKGSNVEHWYYFEHMTLAEAKQQENKFVMPLSVNDRRQIESKLEKLAKGEISLPEGVLVA